MAISICLNVVKIGLDWLARQKKKKEIDLLSGLGYVI